MEIIFKFRNFVIKILYKYILKKIFFLSDPEDVHDRMVKTGKFLGKYKFTQFLTKCMFDYSNPMLEQNILGIDFRNPIGLAAGFDKNAELIQIMKYVGFGHEEIGSITALECKGNPRPRLWRLKKSESLLVYYGLKNDGAKKLYEKLSKLEFSLSIGISIAKTNNKETCDTEVGINDYLETYRIFSDLGDYFTINISCPNTFGGQPFTDKERFEKLISKIAKEKKTKPIFVKLSPDLPKDELDNIILISEKYKIDGFIISNLTKKRENSNIKDELPSQNGGMSGKIVQELSDNLITYIYKKTRGEKTIIGLGGVFTAEDAYKKIKSGASLIQLITGMIFEGPQLISDINIQLVEMLKKDGYKNISEAVGVDVR